MHWLYLAIAIVSEVVATSALKAAEGFTRPVPSILVVVGYSLAFYFLSLVLNTIPLGVTYAIWSGVGIALVTVVGWIVYHQVLDLAGIIGIGLIVAGVVVLSLFSKTGAHRTPGQTGRGAACRALHCSVSFGAARGMMRRERSFL